jgi:hypothetical protein
MVLVEKKNNTEEHEAMEKRKGQLMCERVEACTAARGCHCRCDACN